METISSVQVIPGSEARPWDLQPGETARAYKAFTVCRDLGYDRTLQQVATSQSLSVSRIAQLSRAHNWKERVRAWVQGQDRQQQEALAEYRLRILTEHLSLAEGDLLGRGWHGSSARSWFMPICSEGFPYPITLAD